MPLVHQWRILNLRKTKVFSNPLKPFLLGLKETVFFGINFRFIMPCNGFTRILCNRGQRRIGKGKASVTFACIRMCQNPESIGITFKMSQIRPLLFCYFVFVNQAFVIREIMRNSCLPRMPECRITQVMRQTGRCNDIPDFTDQRQPFIEPGFIFF
jgi:hypothetical protein